MVSMAKKYAYWIDRMATCWRTTHADVDVDICEMTGSIKGSPPFVSGNFADTVIYQGQSTLRSISKLDIAPVHAVGARQISAVHHQ